MGCHRRFKGRRACAERSIERSKRSECCCRHCKRRHACTERTIERSKRSGPPRKQSKSDFKPAWALNKQAGHRRSTARRSGPKVEHRSGTGCSQKANERSHAGTHRHLGGATARHGDGRSGGTGRRHQSENRILRRVCARGGSRRTPRSPDSTPISRPNEPGDSRNVKT